MGIKGDYPQKGLEQCLVHSQWYVSVTINTAHSSYGTCYKKLQLKKKSVCLCTGSHELA